MNEGHYNFVNLVYHVFGPSIESLYRAYWLVFAAQVAGLIKNERYRIRAWVRPQAGANFGIGARDQVDKTDGPNKGRVTFDLSNRKILTSDGNARAGTEQVGEWLTVWIDLPTTDGQYVVNFYIYSGAQFSFARDGKLGVPLGGVAVD
jgi:hypothetical protein